MGGEDCSTLHKYDGAVKTVDATAARTAHAGTALWWPLAGEDVDGADSSACITKNDAPIQQACVRLLDGHNARIERCAHCWRP